MDRHRTGGLAGWTLAAGILLSAPVCGGQTPTDAKKTADTATQAPMTKEQAKELFKSVDEILDFVSADTKLPIVHPVKRTLISREKVNGFLRKKFDEDEGTKRMERSEIVLKKFGLLDRDFNLRPFLITLLTEQIAGYYDNKTKTVNLLDWIAPEEQKPVLAHELTHALQDQKVDLTAWSDRSVKGTARTVQEDNRHIQVDEAETARSAVAEGQAMVTFIDYSLKGTGKTLADAPELADKLKDSVADTNGSPVLARAPLLLQQSLLFPYGDGLAFEQAVLVKAGKEAAFGGVLANPPSSSFEIMHPAAYLAHASVPVLRMPDIHPLIDAEYVPYDLGVMGELDVRILTELFAGREMSAALTPAWNGGIYYAAQRKASLTAGVRASEKSSTASIGLLYFSRWKNVDSARSFLRVYAAQIPRKYSGVARRKADETDESEQVYTTKEGDVYLAIQGNSVFIGEGFSLVTARKLRDAIAGVQSEGPMMMAEEAGHEPAMSMAGMLFSFGLAKAGMHSDILLRGNR